MKRADLEHILRACKGTTGETEFIVVGSQAILGKHGSAHPAQTGEAVAGRGADRIGGRAAPRAARGGVGDLPRASSGGGCALSDG